MGPNTPTAKITFLISAFCSQKAYHSDSTLATMEKQPIKCFANRQNPNTPIQPLGSFMLVESYEVNNRKHRDAGSAPAAWTSRGGAAKDLMIESDAHSLSLNSLSGL